ncbi:hypothetical protein TNCV_538861 [Trichonephila clavipes]|nr:hypothetical protein TNCV_538861 [Trichonephila clavipes]
MRVFLFVGGKIRPAPCLPKASHTFSMGFRSGECAGLLPSNVCQQFFGRSAFLRQQETDLSPADLWCACFLFADRTIYLSSAGVVLLTRPPPCRLLHIPVVLNDFHSRETTL